MYSYIIIFLLCILLIVIIAISLSQTSKVGGEEDQKISGGYREIIIDDLLTNNEIIEYEDDIHHGMKEYNTRISDYVDMKSNQQIQTVVMKGSIGDYARLLTILGKYYKVKGPNRLYAWRNLIGHKGDQEIYNDICKRFNRNEESRGIYQAQETLRPLFHYFKDDLENKFKKYLDVGCGNGLITNELARIIKADEVHCVEANKDLKHPDIKYHYVFSDKNGKDEKLPYADNYFDLVTAFMALHHVEKLPEMIKELYRVIKPGGILFIKEHDCWNAFDAMLIDIEHAIFMVCNDGVKDLSTADYFIHYKNYYGWDRTILPFKYLKSDYYYIHLRNEISATRAFYIIAQKEP